YSQMAAANAIDSTRFPDSPAQPRSSLDTNRPLLVASTTLLAWYRAGILDTLANWPGGLVMNELDRSFALQQGELATTTEAARELATRVVGALNKAIEEN